MNRYLIKLAPLSKYFFGGDMTFQVGKDTDETYKAYNESYSSYIIESSRFPQQTSLLGMMRYLLLTKSPDVFSTQENRIISKGKASDLIGCSSFRVINPACYSKNNFGQIHAIGPCFLMKGGEYYLPVPKDYELEISFLNAKTASYNGRELRVPEIANYNPKNHDDDFYFNAYSGEIVKGDDIFKKDIRIGINKNYLGKSDENGFYKQISYRLADGYCFAFVVDTTFDLALCQSEFVSLGGDSSCFSLSATRLAETDSSLPSYRQISEKLKIITPCCRVVLLSESLIDPDWIDAIFSITYTVPFRFLQTSVDTTKDYSILSKDAIRSVKYHLYQKGSVFYFEDKKQAEVFSKSIAERGDFHEIGYNYSELVIGTKQ